MRDGLKQRCITRDLKWGIPVPLDGYRDKVRQPLLRLHLLLLLRLRLPLLLGLSLRLLRLHLRLHCCCSCA